MGGLQKSNKLLNLENHSTWPCMAEKKCFEETIAIVGSFHSNYLLDWLDIFSECLTLPVRAPTVFNLPFFDRKLIKSVPIATVVIQWKFDSKSSFFLPDFFDAVNCKDIELLIFWLRACRSGVFSGFFQQCQAMLDLLKIFI